jgi:predicted kinase
MYDADTPRSDTTPVLVLTGPVGVGKTTIAGALSELLAEIHIPHALIDLDWLRWCYPSPPDDPFQMALGLRNLALLWPGYRAAGARRLILADVGESRAARDGYRAALPDAELTIVRLQASVPTLHRRLEQRESGASLAWHQLRAAELALLTERAAVEDLLVDTEDKAVPDIARTIFARIGWGSGTPEDELPG